MGNICNDLANWETVGASEVDGHRVRTAIYSSKSAACAVAFGLLSALSAQAAEFTGKVIRISDGDTLTVLVDRNQIKVRLMDIDAPESKQAFGSRSKQSLSELCFGKIATLQSSGSDRYKRTLAQVTCNGTDANTEQVRRGMAWVYERYAPTGSPLYGIQAESKLGKRGLWVDTSPVPPWEWRRAQATTSR